MRCRFREGCARDDFRIGYDRREVACPHGQVGKGWPRPRLAQALRSTVWLRGRRLRVRPQPRHAPRSAPGKAQGHLEHVLTAIPVNIERLSQLPPGESTTPRPPMASQDYLDQHDIKHLRTWRAVS